METTTTTNADNGNRIDQFKSDVTELNLKAGNAGREKIAAAFDDIADGNPDAEMHLPLRRMRHIGRAERFLNVDRAACRLDRRGEFAHHPVTRRVEDAPARFLDEIIEHFPV